MHHGLAAVTWFQEDILSLTVSIFIKKERKKMSTDVITNANAKSRTKVRMMVQIGMLAAISVVLMQFEVPLPFAPAFYKIDFSEVPVLVGCFAMGPFAGAVIELIKIILHVAISGTTTAGVGDVANFLIEMCIRDSCYTSWISSSLVSRHSSRTPNRSCMAYLRWCSIR